MKRVWALAMFAFDLHRLLQLTLSISVAFVLATLIGAERQYRQRNAGLRTNVLVAVGAAAFVSIGERVNGNAGAAQVAAYVVSGIGFLGAGVIMKDGSRVSGLNTAATLWCSASVGVLAGIGLMAEAVVVTIAILAGNTLLRPLVNAINRAPIDERATESSFDLHAVTEPEHVAQVRELMIEALEKASYPVRDVEVVERSDDLSELSATLVSTAIEPEELDAVAAELERSALVSHASWSSSAEE